MALLATISFSFYLTGKVSISFSVLKVVLLDLGLMADSFLFEYFDYIILLLLASIVSGKSVSDPIGLPL